MTRGSARILVLSSGDPGVKAAKHVWQSAGHKVAELQGTVEGLRWLRMHPVEVVVVDLAVEEQKDADGGELLAVLRAVTPAQILALVRARPGRPRLGGVLRDPLTHVLAVSDGGAVDPIALTVTVAKILTRDIFGSDRYLAAGASEWTCRVRSSLERVAVGEAARAFANQPQCHPEVARAFVGAVGELVNNALYAAPTDPAGKPKFSHLPRTTPVTLSSAEEVMLRLTYDGRRLCMSASDPFGSLRPEEVADCLARCSAGDAPEPEEGARERGRARPGTGLPAVFDLVHHLVVNIAPKRRTEVIGIIDVARSYREYRHRGRSFSLCVGA